MCVDGAQRGRGGGRSSYSTVESWAAARGATEIRLAVLEANEAAERFWRSLGFIEYRRVGPDTFKMRSHRRIELSRRLSGATVEGSHTYVLAPAIWASLAEDSDPSRKRPLCVAGAHVLGWALLVRKPWFRLRSAVEE